MILKQFSAGIYETNNYLLICEETREAALIDASGDFEAVEKLLKDTNAELKYLLNTHGHWDHIMGDNEIQKAFVPQQKDKQLSEESGTYEEQRRLLKVLIHKSDEFYLKMLPAQLVMHGVKPCAPPKINGFLEDNQEITVGNMKIKVIHTPGHTPGGVCFLVEKSLFSGDTLFAQSVGRTDFPGSSYKAIEASIKNKLFTLDDDVVVYPGHGPSTTIGYEKENNPYFGAKVR